jgi:hypothetical protein
MAHLVEPVLYHKKLLEACEMFDVNHDAIKSLLKIMENYIGGSGIEKAFQLDCTLSLACIYSKGCRPQERWVYLCFQFLGPVDLRFLLATHC